MEGSPTFVIHQTVHGYEEGHSLLACSCDLSSKEKITLLKMSDLSGSIATEDFEPYITGYPIPGSNYYALAKTWYAGEMKRPGCVWTHTLLISLPILSRVKDFTVLQDLFKKPEKKHLKNYSNPIAQAATSESESSFYKDRLDRLSYYLYDKPEKPVLLMDQSPEKVGRDLLSLWSNQWPRLRRSFSFCTGAFSIRTLNDKPLDIQVIPKQSDLAFNLRNLSNTFLIFNTQKDDVPTENDWFDAFRNSNLDDVRKFMFEYGSDVNGNRNKYVPLFLAFQFDEQINLIDNALTQLMLFFQQYFPDRNEAKTLKINLLNKLFTIEKKNVYYFLLQQLNGVEDNESIYDIQLDYSSIILDLWESKTISKIELINLLRKIDPEALERRIELLSKLPLETLIKIEWVDQHLVKEILATNPELLNESMVWSESNTKQAIWFDATIEIVKSNTNYIGILDKLVKGMLREKNDLFTLQLFAASGIDVADSALKAVSSLKTTLSGKWEIETLKFPETIIEWISRTELNSYKMLLFLKIIEKQVWVLNSRSMDWSKLLPKVEVNSSHDLSTNIFSQLLALSFQNYLDSSDVVCSLVFQKIHDDAKRGNIEDEHWDFLYRSLPKNHLTAPQRNFISRALGFYGDHVPSWDRCEMLRRSIVECFIFFKWDFDLFLAAIKDSDTFDRILNYCSKSDVGKDFVRKIKNSKSAEYYPKHLKIIKKHKNKW